MAIALDPNVKLQAAKDIDAGIDLTALRADPAFTKLVGRAHTLAERYGS